MAKTKLIPKNAAVKAIKDMISTVAGNKKKFDDPKVEGEVAGYRKALAAVEAVPEAA